MTSNIHYGGQAPQTRSHWGAYSPPARQRYDFVGLCRRLQVRYPEMLARVLAEEPELGEDQLDSQFYAARFGDEEIKAIRAAAREMWKLGISSGVRLLLRERGIVSGAMGDDDAALRRVAACIEQELSSWGDELEFDSLFS